MLFKLSDGGSRSGCEGNLVPCHDGFSDESVLTVFVLVSWDSDLLLSDRASGASMSFSMIREETVDNCWESVCVYLIE